MNDPRYKVIAPNGTMLLGGCFLPYESEVSFLGWPTAALEPANEPARRVFDYYARHRANPEVIGPYKVPTSSLFNAIHLPARDKIGTAQVGAFNGPSIPKPDSVDETMPEYELGAAAYYDGDVLGAGSRVVTLAWPIEYMTALNDPADQVIRYLEENAGHPQLPASPWCEFRRAVVLMELPEIKAKRRFRPDPEPVRAPRAPYDPFGALKRA